MPTLNQERTTQSEFEVRPLVQHAPRSGMKSRRRVAVETGEQFRRDVSRALVRRDQLNAITKAGRMATSPTTKIAVEKPQSARPPATRTNKETPTPAVGPAKVGESDDEGMAVGEGKSRSPVFRPDRTQGPQPGHANSREIIDRSLHGQDEITSRKSKIQLLLGCYVNYRGSCRGCYLLPGLGQQDP
jgi:hypothetical protein